MKNGKLSVQLSALEIAEHGLAGRTDVANRFLFQWVHPMTHTANPLASFVLGCSTGPVDPEALDQVLPSGILFKNLSFAQAFEEPLRLQVHHFVDAHRDALQIAIGTLFESMLGTVLGKVGVGPLTLEKLIDPLASLKLSDETYSLKLGWAELRFEPTTLGGAGVTIEVATVAGEEAWAFAPIGPTGPPRRVKVVSTGQKTSSMALRLRA